MFAPWRSQKSMRKHKDPITGNLFIKYLTERGGIVLAESRGHQLHGRSICLSCPCLSMKTKSEGCNHSIVQSVTLALFDSLVTVTGKCSFLASGTRLWNNLDSATRGLTSLCKFKNQLYKKYIDWNFYFAFLLFEFEVLVDHNENYWFYQ